MKDVIAHPAWSFFYDVFLTFYICDSTCDIVAVVFENGERKLRCQAYMFVEKYLL